MSKLARVLTIGAMLAAMNLAGMTAVAQASNDPAPTRTPGGHRPNGKWGSLGVTR